ncbi:hypothetical protein [Dyella acidisoli]|uniref:pectin lyase n=1 Tax=Dyella acidisoli TaxID=1867834 RepID=A0ABQ5XM90_9GAMM|nr:hypothetical protein [Dyella acidisoli]GLQ91633.1 pectin lyase [Dyella acidisoli]
MLSRDRTFVKTIAAMGLIASGCAAQTLFATDVPEGFGHDTTGGANGEVVTVTTPAQLQNALCGSLNAEGLCADDTPRTIVISGTIDFRGAEGTTSGLGCDPYPNKTEALVLLNSSDTHCNGFTTSQIPYDKVGNDPLLVGSNKTVTSTDGKAVIEGRGLRLVDVQNVVISNLTIQDINPSVIFAGDAITLDGVDNVWIDHNKFFMIGRQMIAAGFGAVTHVTVSWNDFDGSTPYAAYGDGDHYWNMLFESSDQSVTIVNNWVHHFAGRAPIITANGSTGHGVFQIVNNYFQDGSVYGHGLNAYNGIDVLVEANFYDQVPMPILKNANPDQVGSVFGLTSGPHSAQVPCLQILKRNCGTNAIVGTSNIGGFDQDVNALQAFKGSPYLVHPYKASQVRTFVPAGAGPGHI